MEVSMDGYGEILTVDGLFTQEECKSAIQEIDDIIAAGYHHEAPSDIGRKDECIHLALVSASGQKTSTKCISRLRDAVIPEYRNRFPMLNHKDLAMLEIKGQRTPPGGGFHSWHYEAMDGATYNRILTYTLYLNDNFEAGETEFLTQNKRIKPKAGTCVLFPCGFLHTHRGNPPIGATKYILTGWVIDIDPYANWR
jgi:hypothetical protein